MNDEQISATIAGVQYAKECPDASTAMIILAAHRYDCPEDFMMAFNWQIAKLNKTK